MRSFPAGMSSLIVLLAILAPGAIAAPEPSEPIEVARSESVSVASPLVAPSGEQVVTYRSRVTGATATLLIERSNGNAFSAPIELTRTTNAEEPSLSFTPDGGIYAIWGVATSGASAQQTFRLPGAEFAPATDMPSCGRFVDSAASPDGGIAVTCSHAAATNPPNTYGLGTSPGLGLVTVNESINAPVYDPFIRPAISWGRDGTLAVVAGYWTTTTNPPPANQTRRVRVTLRNAAAGLAATADVAQVTGPAEAYVSGRAAVMDDGTVVVALGGTAGARILIRPPGALSVFTTHNLTGSDITQPKVDGAGNIHVMSASPEPPNRQYWSNVRAPGGNFGTPVPIPLGGGLDPYIPFRGFSVAPDGTEYALIRADDGVYATSRSPGEEAFNPPRRLGEAASGNPGATVTADGDLLVAWANEAGTDDYRAYVGGLDRTPPKVLVIQFPERGQTGAQLDFTAQAIDSMGLRSLDWNFGDGPTVAGETATHTFSRPGKHEVSFTATDRAGNQTVIRRMVEIPGENLSTPLRMKLSTPKKMRFRALAKRGVKLRVSSNQPLRIKAKIGTSKRKLKKKPLVTMAITRLRARHVLRLKPKRKRLGKRRKFRLFVQVTGTTTDGERVIKSGRVRIRR